MEDFRPLTDSDRFCLDINRDEFRAILKKAGYSCREFGEHIGKSHTFVSELGMYTNQIPSRWVRALMHLVTPEAYQLHLEKYRLTRKGKS